MLPNKNLVDEAVGLAAIAAEAWSSLLEREPFYGLKSARPVEHLPRGDLAEAQAVARSARERLARLQALSGNGLDRTQRLTKEYLAYLAEADTGEPDLWWSGFGVTPYRAQALAMSVKLFFKPFVFGGTSDDVRYLTLLGDFAGGIEAARERVQEQAKRGWYLPRPALPLLRRMLEGIAAKCAGELLPTPERMQSARRDFGDRISARIENEVCPAFRRLLEVFGPAYESAAPEAVGMSQYPGGVEAYRHSVRFHLSFDADPERIHATGLEEVKQLAQAMAELRSREFGFNGGEAQFHERLGSEARAHAASAQDLEAIYHRHLGRMQPLIPSLFIMGPKAPYKLERLAPELEAGMTYGYYQPPVHPADAGIYYYSGADLAKRLQLNAAPLMFHELVPGHHFHIARQSELQHLPEIRRETFPFGAFNEGWAEYAAGLGEEAGLYDDPHDLYGWLAHQRFIAQRLVVDTGMNLLGWSLQRARDYMSANTLEAPAQVASETLRYSTDMPGQALGYRMGFLKIRELRERARTRLAAHFDIRAFHEAILSQGGLPIAVLERSIDAWIEAEAEKRINAIA